MRVLLVTPFFPPAWAYGGMARATAGLAGALAGLGHDVLVVTTLLGDAPPREDAGGVRIRRLPSLPWIDRRLFPWLPGLGPFLAQVSAQEGIDVAHIAGHRHGLAASAGRALRRAQISWILQPHGTYPHHGARRLSKRLVDRLFARALVDDAAALVAVSDAEAHDLPRPACVIPNGVAPVGTPSETRARASRPRLLFVGSDAPQKRVEHAADLLRALPDASLCLLGRFGRATRRRFAVFGERAVFGGVLAGDALATAYAEADLLIQPAVGEAFGLAAFEAALHGTAAVVAGGHGAGEWYARSGGCVVPPDDLPALVAATRLRLERPDVAAREAAEIADFAYRELTWEGAARRIETLYLDATRQGLSPAGRAAPTLERRVRTAPERLEKRTLSRAIVSQR